MNKGPNIVANRWHEVASSLERVRTLDGCHYPQKRQRA